MAYNYSGYLLAGLLAFFATSAAAQETLPPLKEAGEVAENVQAKTLRLVKQSLQELKSLQASFTMIGPKGQQAQGVLSLKKPGYVRFDFGEKANHLYVADGRVLSVVDYEIGKVEKVPVKDTPLKILLSDDLSFKGLNHRIVTSTNNDGAVALVIEDPAQQNMGELILNFKKLETGAYQLDYWAVRDGQGGVTYVTLKDLKTNLALDEALWTFKDPRGSAKRRRP